MSLLISLAWGGGLLSVFTLQILTESTRQAIKQTFRDCRGMTRTEHFFPKYKHTP